MKQGAVPAGIVGFDFIDANRERLGKIVCTSGGYDPIHPGHLSCITESARYGDTLVIVVNGDEFLTKKKGRAFQDLSTRCRIVSYVRGVDLVVPFEAGEDMTVCGALRLIRPQVFTKGGDRHDKESIPEWQVCKELGIEVRADVGEAKGWASSDFLARWAEYCGTLR